MHILSGRCGLLRCTGAVVAVGWESFLGMILVLCHVFSREE